MTRRTILLFGPIGLAVTILVLFSAGQTATADAQSTPPSGTIHLMAIDANPAGNTATSLGALDGCARAEVGAQITVDVVVDSVPEDTRMIGFETHVTYNPQLLEVVANDYEFLLAAVGRYEPFAHPDLNDTLPDSDGTFNTGVIDLASNDTPGANTEAGAGVLNRVTFQAKAAGVSSVGIEFNADTQTYPTVIDNNNNVYNIAQLGSASIAVGQDCPAGATPVISPLPPVDDIVPTPVGQTPAPTPPATPVGQTPSPTPSPTPFGQTPSPTPTSSAGPSATPAVTETDSGSNTGTIILVVVLAGLGAAAAGAGGWLLYKRSRGGVS